MDSSNTNSPIVAQSKSTFDLLRQTLNIALTGAQVLQKTDAQSIAEQARRSIMMYRVLVSASIREVPLASDITKYLEGMYSIFTLIILGFNPMANDNEDVKKLMDRISAEGLDPATFSAETYGMLGFLNDAMLIHEDMPTRTKPRIGRNASVEASRDEDDEGEDDGSGSYQSKKKKGKVTDEYKLQISGKGSNYTISEDKSVTIDPANGSATLTTVQDVHKRVAASDIQESAFLERLDKIQAYPTILKIKITTSDRNTVSIPIAVKANCYGIKSDELKLLIEAGVSGKPQTLLRRAKWRSGEINTLQYVLNLDTAERDKKLYKELGRNPWYIELMARKAASKGNALVSQTKYKDSELYKFTKDAMNFKGDIPPTASLIVTKDDLVSATRLDVSRFTKNEGFIKKFMKDMFLMCLGIVDMDLETVSFFFMGYDTPFIQTFRELSTSSKDPNQALYESLRELSRKAR